ncbi:MAG: hypothetical protein MZV64_14425 [Ignavibacteriales bacterium]|nr:hypothetical protein [Ignavibacteriales bacterium]
MKKAGIPLGFYYSIMDWHHPDYLPRRAWETTPDGRRAPTSAATWTSRRTSSRSSSPSTTRPSSGSTASGSTRTRSSGPSPSGRCSTAMKPALLINDRLYSREPGHGDFGTPENYVPGDGHPQSGRDAAPLGGLRHDELERLGLQPHRDRVPQRAPAHPPAHRDRQQGRQPPPQRRAAARRPHPGRFRVPPPGDRGLAQDERRGHLRHDGQRLRAPALLRPGHGQGLDALRPRHGLAGRRQDPLAGAPDRGQESVPPGRPVEEPVFPALCEGYRRRLCPTRAIDPDATVVVLELEAPPVVAPYRIVPEKDGRVDLPIYLADIQSEMGQRAYVDHFYRTTMLANWQNVNDYPEWVFSTAKAGTYEVRASYASMWGGKAGYEVEVDGMKLAATTESSPSVYFPATFPVGRVDLGAGEHKLRVRITCVTNNHAMNLEKVVLVPVAR